MYVCVLFSNEMYVTVGSSDSEDWVHTADSTVELLAVLRQQGDLTAEFFLLCLEVCHCRTSLSMILCPT